MPQLQAARNGSIAQAIIRAAARSNVTGLDLHRSVRRARPRADSGAIKSIGRAACVLMFDFQFTKAAANRLGQITRENLKQRLAIVVEGKVLLAPRIESEIKNGIVRLTGAFTKSECEEIVAKIGKP